MMNTMRRLACWATLLLLLFSVNGMARKVYPLDSSYRETGKATFYGKGAHGRKTASGERIDNDSLFCAHKKLPFGTWIEVRHLKTGKTVRVKVIDRGPFSKGRIVDLSYRAARELGILRDGVAKVEIRICNGPEPEETAPTDSLILHFVPTTFQ